MTAGTESQKINPLLDLNKIDINVGGGSGFDKVTFDSLLTSLKSETIDRSPAPKNDYHAEQAKRNQEYADRNNSIGNRSDEKRTQDNNRDIERTDKTDETGKSNESYRAETERQKTKYADSKSKSDENEISTDSSAINKDSEQSNESKENETSEGNAVKIGSLLFELANTKTAELTNAAANTEGAAAVTTDTEQESGQGLKNGALLNELLKGKTDETVTNTSANGKEAQGQAGLKVGDLLKDLVNAQATQEGKNQAEEAKGENAKAINTEALKTENGLKVGEQIKTTADVKTNGIEKELANVTAKQTNADSEITDTEVDELIKKLDNNGNADKKSDIKQDQVKEHKLQDFMAQKDTQESNNAKATISKVQPGMVENLFRESGVKPNVNATAKTAGENSDTNNISALSDVSAKSGGSKINAASPTGTIAKPSGFADVVNKIVYVAKGDNKLGVTVEHKDLGQLNIKLSLEKGVVNVHINTTDKAAREFVESNVQQLVDSLSKNGVSIGGFSVGLKNQQQHQGFSNNNSNKNDKAFSINGIEQQEYSKAAANVYSNNGRVSVFA